VSLRRVILVAIVIAIEFVIWFIFGLRH